MKTIKENNYAKSFYWLINFLITLYSILVGITIVGVMLRQLLHSSIGFYLPAWNPLAIVELNHRSRNIYSYGVNDFFILISASVVYFGYLYVLLMLKNLAKNFLSGVYFCDSSTLMVRKIGIAIMIFSFISNFVKMMIFMGKVINPVWASITGVFFFFVQPVFVIGLLIYFISLILVVAGQIKEENDLTV